MQMSEYFDVGKMPPGTPDCVATRCINLMCAILKGTDYDTVYTKPLYGENNDTLELLIDNVNKLPPVLQRGATDDSPIVIEKLAGENGAFVQIAAKLSEPGAPPLVLGELFYEPRQADPPDPLGKLRNFVVDTLEAVHTTTNDQMYHFCMPILAMQLGRTPSITKTEFESFIEVLGGKTLQDFYDKPYNKEQKTAAVAARRLQIFHEKRPAGSAPTPPSGQMNGEDPPTKGNGFKCSVNICTHSTESTDWCTEVTFPDGSTGCALGSD
jgi:hypothetical protein